MCWLCIYVPYWPFKNRRQCRLALASILVAAVLTTLVYDRFAASGGGGDLTAAKGENDDDLSGIYRDFGDEEDGEEEDEEELPIFDRLDPNEVPEDNSLFFFVASGAKDLTGRESCTVESAAKLHPGRKVFVIFLSRNITDVMESRSLSLLISYENIHLRYIKTSEYFYHPALKEWFMESEFQFHDDYDQYLSNALTYIFLNKFGGSVLNFDVLLLKPITALGDFLASCDEDSLEIYPLSLRKGHPMLDEVSFQLKDSFTKISSKSTGSLLITETVRKKCRVKYIKELHYKDCTFISGAKILSPGSFCPVEEEKHWTIFDKARAKLVLQELVQEDNSLNNGWSSYGIKLWNEMNGVLGSWGGSSEKTAFYNLAKSHCPLSFQMLSFRKAVI